MNPLLNEQQQELLEKAQAAVDQHVVPAADRIDAEAAGCREVLRELSAAGLLDGGGAEQPMLDIALRVEQIARKSGAVATVAATHSVATMLVRSAGISLPEAVAADALLALAHGSVEATATDSGHRLDGQTGLTPGATLADWLLVDAGQSGLFLVPADADGVSIGEPAGLLGLNGCGAAEVSFSGVMVVSSARVGGAEEATTARDLQQVAYGAVAVGLARGALDAALDEVQQRREDGDRLDRSQAVQWILADNATETEAARVAVWYAACQTPGAAQGEAAAMGRLLAAEAAVQSTRRTLQVFGERGLTRGAGVERLYRDAKLMEVLGGTNETQLARVAQYLLPDLNSG